MKRFFAGLVAIVAIALIDTSCTPDTVMLPGRVDTLIVQRPGHVDTIVVVRPDTVVVTKPETTFRQLPGRIDTVVRVDTLVTPPRVDTLYVPKIDTLVVNHYDTSIVVRPETLIVVKHDTVIVHDTVTHYDTVRLTQTPAYICIYMTMGDTLVAFNWATTPYCDAAHLALNVAGTWSTLLNVDSLTMKLPSIQAALTRMANRPPSPLILPGYWMKHR